MFLNVGKTIENENNLVECIGENEMIFYGRVKLQQTEFETLRLDSQYVFSCRQ